MLNTKIKIQSKTISRGDDGSEVETWGDVIETWAEKKTQGSREFYAAQKINAETTALFVIRFRSATISRDMRVLEGDRVFEIISIDNTGNQNHWFNLMCKEVNVDGA